MHVLDGSSPDPCGDFSAIQQELGLFSPELADKRQLVAYNKMDLPESADYEDIVREFLLKQVRVFFLTYTFVGISSEHIHFRLDLSTAAAGGEQRGGPARLGGLR